MTAAASRSFFSIQQLHRRRAQRGRLDQPLAVYPLLRERARVHVFAGVLERVAQHALDVGVGEAVKASP